MSPDPHHLSGAYALDALDAGERADVEAHLAGCATCRAEVAELTAAAHSLTALTEAEPPVGLRGSVLDGIHRVRPLPPPRAGRGSGGQVAPQGGGGPTVVPFRRRTSTWLPAVAAVLLISVGGLAWHPWSAREVTLSAVDQVRSAPDARTVTSSTGDLTATLAYSRGLGRSAIAVTGLPPAPQGRTYQLWYIPARGAPRPAGFLESRDGRGSAVLRGTVGDASAVGVTVEPVGGSSAPTTDPLVVMALG